jgi:MOSC domain-containing protein YiiM
MSSAGQLAGIYLGTERGAGKTACTTAELVAGHGLQGDSHAGDHPQRHISLFAQETVHALQTEGFNVTPSALSANLFLTGLPLDTLPLGTQLRIGPVLIEISEQRKPCRPNA